MCYKKCFLWGIAMIATAILLTSWVGSSQAQKAYPTRPIDIICPMAPGGGTDLTDRVIAAYLNKKFKVPVNVVNKPGGNTVPAVLEVYKSPPDGYTLLGDGSICSDVLPVTVKNLPFKIMDRTFIGAVSNVSVIIIVPSNSPIKSLKDLEAEAKKDPESFTWTSLGGVGNQDVAARQFLKAIGVDVKRTKPIMGKGGSEAAVLTAGGNVKMGLVTPASGQAVIKGGNVRALAISTPIRNSDFPEIPTTKELGYPTVNAISWYGISGPPKLPSDVVEVLSIALKEMSNDPDTITKMKNVGVTPHYMDAKTIINHVTERIEEMEILWGVK